MFHSSSKPILWSVIVLTVKRFLALPVNKMSSKFSRGQCSTFRLHLNMYCKISTIPTTAVLIIYCKSMV